ncbi:MAG: hypothetical protein GEU75_02905 [Dehalococcoidia bacterium]|nr:hypothetical protein [Dehalococcoidia bacterium]
MQDKMMNLSLGEKLVAGGGILMLIASFLPWYRFSFSFEGIGGASISRNGWQDPATPWSLLAVIIAVALAGSIIAVKFGNVKLPAIGNGVTWGMIYGGGAAVIVLLILLTLISESSFLSYGFYLAAIATAAIAYGGYLLYSEEKKRMMRT